MKCLIWSIEHGQWWKPDERGYTSNIKQAGVYDSRRAVEICAAANGGIGNVPDEAVVPVVGRLKKVLAK